MSKHTPGPWIVDPNHPQDISPADDLRLGVASICNSDNIDGRWVFAEVSKANAALIAAAPEMLEALLDAKEWLSGWASAEPYLSKIEAIIAKATA